jgi:hypothetical protein
MIGPPEAPAVFVLFLDWQVNQCRDDRQADYALLKRRRLLIAVLIPLYPRSRVP